MNQAPQTPTYSIQDAQKALEQRERKREYNRKYYDEKIKAQREEEKRDIEKLKAQNVQLQEMCTTLSQIKIQNEQTISQLISIVEDMKVKMEKLYDDNCMLTNK